MFYVLYTCTCMYIFVCKGGVAGSGAHSAWVDGAIQRVESSGS